MLIFWKFLFPEDHIHYEKDPTRPVNNASEIEPYTPTFQDKAICYTLGIFLIIPWLISTSLNPLLFWYFRRIRRRISAKLKKYLAVTDFLTNVWAPLPYVYFMLVSDLVPLSHPALRYVRTWACMFGCFSQILGFLLAATRVVKIVFPLFNLKQGYVIIYLICYCSYMILNNGTYFVVSEFFTAETWGMRLLKIGLDLCFWANLFHCCAGLSLSVFTVIYLFYTIRFIIKLIPFCTMKVQLSLAFTGVRGS
jgi:hypothetical protein